MTDHQELASKINELEAKYDNQFTAVFQALRALMQEKKVSKERRMIGFKIGIDDNKSTG